MLVPLEVYTATHILAGTLEIGRQRLSDFLSDPGANIVALQEAWIADLARPGAPSLRLVPANFRKHDVIFAVAQDRLDPPGPMRSRFVRTAPLQVAASAGPFLIRGEIHISLGEHFDVRRLFGPESRPFVPITHASVTYTPNPNVDARYSVLVVRTDKVQFAGLVETSTPPPVPFLAAVIEDRLRTLIGGKPRPDE
jgi:hypothetical protein